MTARTTREAFGQQLGRSAFEPQVSWVDDIAKLSAWLVVLSVWVGLIVWFVQDDTAELVSNRCEFMHETVDGRGLWQCRDGWRVSNNKGDGL